MQKRKKREREGEKDVVSVLLHTDTHLGELVSDLEREKEKKKAKFAVTERSE